MINFKAKPEIYILTRHDIKTLYHIMVQTFNDMYVTRLGKTDQLGTFIVLRSVNLKNSQSHNLAVVSSKGMGLALETQHLFSFK